MDVVWISKIVRYKYNTKQFSVSFDSLWIDEVQPKAFNKIKHTYLLLCVVMIDKN